MTVAVAAVVSACSLESYGNSHNTGTLLSFLLDYIGAAMQTALQWISSNGNSRQLVVAVAANAYSLGSHGDKSNNGTFSQSPLLDRDSAATQITSQQQDCSAMSVATMR